MTKEIKGQLAKLPSGGSVWLSNGYMKSSDDKDCRGVIFTNPDGIETRLCLSDEALRALNAMAVQKTTYEEMVWTCVGAMNGILDPSVNGLSEKDK